MKHPHIPLQAKVDACLLQLGLDPRGVEWDHQPPLAMREYDEATGKYTPDANDPRYLVPLEKAAHRAKTAGTKVPLSGDVSQIYKMRRLTKSHAEFQRRLLAKQDGVDITTPASRKKAWPSRPFSQKRPRPGS